LESRTARYKDILPLCEQIDSFEIGFPELVVFRSAAFRIAEMEKQLNDTIMKIQMVNLVSARQSDAVIALAKLQCYGITENQILNLCKTIEVNGHSMTGAQPTNSNSYYAF
jgi:hypothetical protein